MKKLGNVYELEYEEFETIVKECLNISEYSFVEQEESLNDTYDMFYMPKEFSWYEEFGENDIENYRNGTKKHVSANDLFEELMYYNILPKANYLVWVSW